MLTKTTREEAPDISIIKADLKAYHTSDSGLLTPGHSLTLFPGLFNHTKTFTPLGFFSKDDLHYWMDSTENTIQEAWSTWFTSIPTLVARKINQTLFQLTCLLEKASTPLDKLRIGEMLVRCHGLLGSISLENLKNQAAYQHYFHAHRLALKIHDRDQAITYLTLIGDTLRRQGKKHLALNYVEEASTYLGLISPATRSHVLQVLAYLYADTGQSAKFEETISKALDCFAYSHQAKDMARRERFPFQIYEVRGKSYRELGNPFAALECLETAAAYSQMQEMTPRWHAAIDISRGQIYCDLGDLRTGLSLASRGFLLAYTIISPRQMNRVRKLLRKLTNEGRENEREVSELRQLVAYLLTTPRLNQPALALSST